MAYLIFTSAGGLCVLGLWLCANVSTITVREDSFEEYPLITVAIKFQAKTGDSQTASIMLLSLEEPSKSRGMQGLVVGAPYCESPRRCGKIGVQLS